MGLDDIPETKKEFRGSWILIIWAAVSLVIGTFWVTSFYHDIRGLEGRSDKRYKRLDAKIDAAIKDQNEKNALKFKAK